ncbi:MAG TPA: GGDEF domain-containing protein, partial [Telluria sp.]|nr:GGDEF domain-containing protein [Telluria sp.]
MRKHDPLPESAGAVAHFAGWEVDLPARTAWWSAQAFAIFELPPGPAPTIDQAIDMCMPQYRATLRACLEACVRDGEPFDEDVEAVTAGGRRIRLH